MIPQGGPIGLGPQELLIIALILVVIVSLVSLIVWAVRRSGAAADKRKVQAPAPATYVMVTMPDGSQQMMPLSQSGGFGPNPADYRSGGIATLGFFFPMVGLILYLVWKDQTPRRAHSAGKGALIGVITYAAVSVISVIAFVVMINNIPY